MTQDIALAGEVERAEEVTTPEKKILARVEHSWWDYGFREETNQADDCLGELLGVSDPDRIAVPVFASC